MPLSSFYLLAALAVFSVIFYTRLTKRILAEGGQVNAENYRRGDLVVSLMLCTWFLVSIVSGFIGETQEVTSQGVVSGGIAFGVLIAAILTFTGARKVSGGFGFARQNLWKVFKYGFLYLMIAYPVILLGMAIVNQWTQSNDAQPIVQYFLETKTLDQRLLFALFAVVLAPFSEELIFRGYLYGVFKKYLGIKVAFLVTGCLFALIHLYLPSFGVFLILSLALTAVYEATGSIWTSMVMHAIFNAISLLFLIFAPHLAV